MVFISAPLPSQERPAPGEAHSPRRMPRKETADLMVWTFPDGAPGRDQQGQPLTLHWRWGEVGGGRGGVFLLPPGRGSQAGEQGAVAKPTAAGSPLPTASAVVTVAPGGAKAPWGGGIWGRDQSADYPWAQPQGGRAASPGVFKLPPQDRLGDCKRRGRQSRGGAPHSRHPDLDHHAPATDRLGHAGLGAMGQ